MRPARILIAVGTLSLLAAAPNPAQLPDWMAGCWVEDRGQKWFEECWTSPRAGILIGSGRTGEGDTLKSWEAMQIVLEPNGTLAFYGAPEGQGRTRFERESVRADGLTFVNADHDYPQRVRYWREGDNLLAEVSLLDGSNAMRWSYRRAGQSNWR